MLQKVRLLTGLLLTDEYDWTLTQQLILTRMIVCCIRLIQDDRIDLSSHFNAILPSLVVKFQSEPSVLAHLIQIPRVLTLDPKVLDPFLNCFCEQTDVEYLNETVETLTNYPDLEQQVITKVKAQFTKSEFNLQRLKALYTKYDCRSHYLLDPGSI